MVIHDGGAEACGKDKVFVFVTCGSLEEADGIARAVVERRLAACASVGGPVHSRYWWKGSQEEATEFPLTLKTRRDKLDTLEEEIRRLHSYEVPEIVAVRLLAGSTRYLQWMDESLEAG